jgi:predicted ATPase/class 3 adenylate cyclase
MRNAKAAGARRQQLPTGTVSFLMTDIEGSTRLVRSRSVDYGKILDAHRHLVRVAAENESGIEVDATGDAMFFAFPTARNAMRGAVAAQRMLAEADWPVGGTPRVRMGIHTGVGTMGAEGYVGVDVHIASRIATAAHGGQVLCSDVVRELALPELDQSMEFRDRGRHRLKDVDRPVRLWQVVAPGLDVDFPSPRAARVRASLPVRATSLVGRDEEVARLCEAVFEYPLITLVGPGGTGKTRLAVAVAASVEDRFAEGVAFVDLSAIRDPDLVASTIANALELMSLPGVEVTDTLFDHVSSREMLLLLDNFEQVLPAAGLVADLVHRARATRILVTSRAPLALRDEQEWPVAPLAVPDGPVIAAETVFSPAVQLFVDRARSVSPGFALDDSNVSPIVNICRRLDGMPLAIEIAASRLRILSPETLDRRLSTTLDLASGLRDAPDRQRTLRSAIGWSADLLGDSERRLFSRLAVFRGGWALDAAEAVASPSDLPGVGVVNDLESLVAHSLVRVIELSHRMTMLEIIREFAEELLAHSGEANDVRLAHARYFRQLAESAEPKLLGPNRDQIADELRDDLDNFRAATEFALTSGDMTSALVIGSSLLTLWHVDNRFVEARHLLEGCLARDLTGVSLSVIAKAHAAAGELALYQSDFRSAAAHTVEALEAYRAGDDPVGIAHELCNLGWGNVQRNAPAALGLFAEALTVARKADDRHGEGNALTGTSVVHYRLGEWEAARTSAMAAVTAFNAIGEQYLVVFALLMLALVDMHFNRLREAAIKFAELLPLAQRAGGADVVASSLEFSALLLMRTEPKVGVAIASAAEVIKRAAGGATGSEMALSESTLHVGRRTLEAQDYESALAQGLVMTREDAFRESLRALNELERFAVGTHEEKPPHGSATTRDAEA